MTYDVRDRVVLITGAARGIGAETARRLAARGARLSLVGLEPERLATLATELGPAHRWFAADVASQAALERAVAGTIEAFGGIDVVIANAGVATNGTVAVTPADALARVIEVNLTGVIRTVHATLAAVTARRGYVLLVSSVAAVAPMPGLSAYAASKAGVETFGNVLRLEVARHGVAVGVAHPCWVDTDLVRDTRRDLASFEQALRRLPGPFGTVTSVAACADAFVDAIARRRRRVFVPKSIGPLAAIRGIFASSLAERVLGAQAARTLPALEEEVRRLGRAFGEHSAGMGENAAERVE